MPFGNLHWVRINWVTAARDLPAPTHTSSSLASAVLLVVSLILEDGAVATWRMSL